MYDFNIMFLIFIFNIYFNKFSIFMHNIEYFKIKAAKINSLALGTPYKKKKKKKKKNIPLHLLTPCLIL